MKEENKVTVAQGQTNGSKGFIEETLFSCIKKQMVSTHDCQQRWYLTSAILIVGLKLSANSRIMEIEFNVISSQSQTL